MPACPQVPNEIWLEVMNHLPTPHITARKVSQVSRTFYALALPAAYRVLVVTESNILNIEALLADNSMSDISDLLSGTAAQRICRYNEVQIICTQKWRPTLETSRLFRRVRVIHSLQVPLLSILAQMRKYAVLPSLSELHLLEPFTLEYSLPPTVKRVSIRYREKVRSRSLRELETLIQEKQLEILAVQIYDRLETNRPLAFDEHLLDGILSSITYENPKLDFVLHTRGRASGHDAWARYTRAIGEEDNETRRRVRVWRDTRMAQVHNLEPSVDVVEDTDLDVEDAGNRVDLWSQARALDDADKAC